MARSTLAGLIFATALLFAQEQPKDSSFQQAGVCSRCHVVQVLEWSASKHTRAATTCQSCHGPSAGHVANERNQVKPDQPAPPCATCHASGCPKTKQTTNCQSCHHQHALSNPNDRLQPPTAAADPRAAAFQKQMSEGERQVKLANWAAARDAFSAAAGLVPNDRRAAARLRMSERRLHPAAPGFEIIGNAFDPESGLPLHVRVQGLGIEMLLVPAAETDIGSDAWPASRPVHSVFTEPFYLAKYELTQQQWTQLQSENPSPHKGPTLPVHGISWNDARGWIARLNARVPGAGFRLPTEAEWERAAQAPANALMSQAWFRDNSASVPAANAPFREAGDYQPHPVGAKRANAAGFFDMQGNVAEWCSSLLRPYPYDARDGREASEANDRLRVIRGGAFTDSADYLHPAFRHAERPTRRNDSTGLRLAR
jgi:formylglycine-generating enzyme required for sulfatase activity